MARATKGLYKRGQTWWMTYRDALGTQRFESCKTSRKEDAEYQLACCRKEAMEGIAPAPKIKPVSLETLAERYLAWAKVQRGSVTKEFHFGNLKRYLGNVPIHSISVEMLDRYREARQAEKMKPATINREMSTLKHALTMAVRWKLLRAELRRDLAGLGKLEEPSGRLRYLSGPEEAKQLIDACHGVLKPIVITALNTGARKGELLSLTWEAVDLKHGFIHLERTKNGERRDIPLNETVRAILTAYRTRIDVPWVFHDADGHKFTDIRTGFLRACKAAQLTDFHFHDLRHSFASWLVMRGVDLTTVRELLGHKSLAMTLRYAHLSPQHTAAAVRVLDEGKCSSLDNHLTIRGENVEKATSAVFRVEAVKCA